MYMYVRPGWHWLLLNVALTPLHFKALALANLSQHLAVPVESVEATLSHVGCLVEACTGTEITHIPTRPRKDLFPSPLVQRLTKYDLSCNEKCVINLGCIMS